MSSGPVARGFGPKWLRNTLVVLALIYYFLLVKQAPVKSWTRAINFFTQATCLFPAAATFVHDYRLAAWSCTEHKWMPLDHRAYFSIRSEDKESRFYRLAHFYKRNSTVLHALDKFIFERHTGVDDGVPGPIGGIKLFQVMGPIPPVGSDIERYQFEPLPPIPKDQKDLYYTPGPERSARCKAQR